MFGYLRRFGPPLLILGGLYCCVGVAPWCAWKAYREASWPVVEGQMRDVSIESHVDHGWEDWEVVLSYEYRARGRKWIGDQWSTGRDLEFYTQAGAQERAREFLPGTKVTVHYDPEDPSQSALELGRVRSAFAALGGGLFLIACGFIQWRAAPRRTIA